MALSVYDETFMKKEDQSKVKKLTDQLETNPEKLNEIHSAVEQIRSNYGYSGGKDGSQFVKLDNKTSGDFGDEFPTYEGLSDQIPEAPNYDDFEAPELPDFDKIDVPEFEFDGSEFETKINDRLSKIKSKTDEGFDYEAGEDEAYQAYKNEMLREGNRAYQSNMAQASAMTGGSTSSYGQAVASQSRNRYLQQATDAIPQFRNQALNEYKMELESQYQLLNQYRKSHQTEYNEAVDTYNRDFQQYQNKINIMEKEYANKLNNYKMDIELADKMYDRQYSKFKDMVELKRSEIKDAWQRTETLGYVSNQDANILGLEPGTLSQDARQQADELEMYTEKLEKDLENYKKKLDYDIKKEREQATWELNNLNVGTGGSGGSTTGGDAIEINPFNLDDDAREEIMEFEETMNSQIENVISRHEQESELSGVEGKTFYDLPEEEQKSILKNKFESIRKGLKDSLKMEIKQGDSTGAYRELRKLKILFDSTWYSNYGDKARKEAFYNEYNTIIGKIGQKEQAENKDTSTSTSELPSSVAKQIESSR